jgi:hypothetical protein
MVSTLITRSVAANAAAKSSRDIACVVTSIACSCATARVFRAVLQIDEIEIVEPR